MACAQGDGARLHDEETGRGHPIILVREFGADHREWESQVRCLSCEYRCVTFCARGYPPADVPPQGALAEAAAHSPTRIQLRRQDPRGWAEHVQHLRGHSPEGSARTPQFHQGGRDPVQAWEA